MKGLLQIIRYISRHPLASRHKIKAYLLFLRWQIGQKLLPYPVEYPFIGNTKLMIRKGLTGATGNIYTGLHEFSDMGFLLHFLRKEDLFVDVGANIGSYTILASGYIGAASISIEPVPQTFEILNENIFINQLGSRVCAINCGIGSSSGKLYFTKDLDTVNHVVLDMNSNAEGVVEVEMKILSGIIPVDRTPSLIKIDVEGFEQEVINGALDILERPALKAIIIELNGSGGRYGYDEEKIHQQLLEKGFLPFNYDPFKRKIKQLNTYGAHNTVYIKDLDFVQSRIVTAPPFEIFSEKI